MHGNCTVSAMSRPATIWFRASTGWYMTTVNAVQHKLAKTEPEARKAFYKLMAGDAPAAHAKAKRHTARWLCDKYLDRTRPAKAAETWRVQHGHLQAFSNAFGRRPADSLKAHEVNEWLDARPWNNSTRGLVVTILKAAFNWAVAEDYLPASPLKKLKRRRIARRERVLTPDESARLLEAATSPFKDFLAILLATGMRPFSEAAKLTAAMIDWGQGRVVLREHKNAKKGKSRVVYFPPDTLALLAGLARRHPTGLLFRNVRGAAWKRDTVHSRQSRLCLKLGIPHASVYSARSGFITAALFKGVPVEAAAELVGTSAKMIWSNYAGIDKNAAAMASFAARAVS